MAKLTDFQLIENVLIYINRIANYTEDLTEDKLYKDSKTIDAVMFCLQQIGKNIAKLSDGFQQKHLEISGIDWAMLAMLQTDDYFLDEELWDVIKDDNLGILNFYTNIETIYLKERQKPENKSIAVIPARFFKKDENEKLPLKKGTKMNSLSDKFNVNQKGFNPINHIASHSSIWTVKK